MILGFIGFGFLAGKAKDRRKDLYHLMLPDVQSDNRLERSEHREVESSNRR